MISDALNWLYARLWSHPIGTHEGVPFIVLHKDQTLVPFRAPVQVRDHAYADLADFAAAVNRRLPIDATDILFDPDQDLVVADGGPREKSADQLVLKLKLHPRWKRWAEVLGKRLDQRAFHKLLISTPDGDTEEVQGPDGPIGTMALVTAQDVGSLRVAKGSVFTGELDPRGFYRVRDQSSTTEVSAKIHSSITVHVPMYLLGADEQVYAITLDLDVLTEGAAPAFVLSCPALDLVRHKAQGDALGLLRSLLAPGYLVGLGTHGVETVDI